MTALIAHSPLHLAVLSIVLAGCCVPEAVRIAYRSMRRGATYMDRASAHVSVVGLGGGVLLGFLAAFKIPLATITQHQETLFWSGIVLLAGGTAFRWHAIRARGRFLARHLEPHVGRYTVGQGPYLLFLHPAFAGALAALLGVALALTNLASVLAVLGGALVSYTRRIYTEELVLRDHLGEARRRTERRGG